MKRRRSSIASHSVAGLTAHDVVASTAGEDSWKTWAGRSHGSSDFEWMDLVRGSKRELQRGLGGVFGKPLGLPPSGATCPVCFCPAETDEWYVTESCSHAVCLDCLKGYATSQVQDPIQSGPLKCPVCPQNLRRKDALVALQGDVNLIEQWDEKIRNQLLKALPSYRPCPHCSNKKMPSSSSSSSPSSDVSDSGNVSNAATSMAAGGGFVTPSCLSPHYQERRDEASKWLDQGLKIAAGGMTTVYALLLWHLVQTPSPSPLVDLFFLLTIPLGAFVPNLFWLRRQVAQQAQTALFRPILVDCPCCEDSFLLPANTAVADAESQQWMQRHTRPCPSCSVPIHKQGGCNHMTCQNCKANFCWACMQLRTACRAFQCTNGARFGNAIPGQSVTIANTSVEDSLVNRIDRILNPTTSQQRAQQQQQHTSPAPYWQNGLVVLGLFGRHFQWVQTLVEPFMQMVAAISATSSWWVVLGVIVWNVGSQVYGTQQELRRRQRALQHLRHAQELQDIAEDGRPPLLAQQLQQRRASVTASEFLLGAEERNRRDRERNNRQQQLLTRRRPEGRTMMFRTEEEMIREALRRSVVDQ